MKITMKDRHLCWPPYFFLGPAMVPPLFSCRIATAKAPRGDGTGWTPNVRHKSGSPLEQNVR